MIALKILLVILKILEFTAQTLGIFFIIHSIPKWKKQRNGAYGTFETSVNKNLNAALEKSMKQRKPVFDSGPSLIGKSVRLQGKDYIVMGEHLETINTRYPENSMSELILFGNGKLKTWKLTPERRKEMYTKFSKTGPVRSREIRKDVKQFCNNSCIQDCTECILKKYGKSNKTE